MLSLLIILQQGVFGVYPLNAMLAAPFSRVVSTAWLLSLVLAFLVKFPLYLVHLWLPKAHVEAPAVGSIILAALLLKLGGYGMLLLSPLYQPGFRLFVLQAIALSGGLAAALLCIRQKDIKVLIAYSSVCHMGIAIAALASPRA